MKAHWFRNTPSLQETTCKWLKVYHVTWLNLGFKCLSLVQGTGKAIDEEGIAARLHHGLLQQTYGDLQSATTI